MEHATCHASNEACFDAAFIEPRGLRDAPVRLRVDPPGDLPPPPARPSIRTDERAATLLR